MAAKKTVKKAAKKVAERRAPKASVPKGWPAKKAKKAENDVEVATDEIMETIDGHELAGSSASQETTIEFYGGIIAACRERVGTIRAEMDDDTEETDTDTDDDIESPDEDE